MRWLFKSEIKFKNKVFLIKSSFLLIILIHSLNLVNSETKVNRTNFYNKISLKFNGSFSQNKEYVSNPINLNSNKNEKNSIKEKSFGGLDYDDLKDISINDLDKFIEEIEKQQSNKHDTTTKAWTKNMTGASTQSSYFSSGKRASKLNATSQYSSYISLSPQTRRLVSELSIYFSIAICLMGIITNFLSLKVFCSTKVPRTSSRTYLIALSVTDLIFLIVHFIDDTCKQIVEQFKLDVPLNLTDQKLSMCRAFALIRSTCRSASPWIIVVFTLERFLVVNYPQHTNVISKPLIAKRLTYIIIIFSILISLYAPILSSVYNIHNPLSGQMKKTPKKLTTPYVANQNENSEITRLQISYGYTTSYYSQTINNNNNKNHINTYNFLYLHHQNKNYRKTCDIKADYRSIYLYFTLFYTILIIVIPLIIVSVFNTLLIRSLYKSTDQWTTAKLEMHEQEMSYKEIKDKQIQIENLKITWTLIIISLTFILLTLPNMIVYFIISNRLVKSSSIQIIHKITELFYLLNHSVNFFLYVISRKSFRKVLKDKLKCDCFNSKHYTIKSSAKSFLHYSSTQTNGDGNSNNQINNIKNTQPLLNHNDMQKTDNINVMNEKNSNNKLNNNISKNNDIDYEQYWNFPDKDNLNETMTKSVVTYKDAIKPNKNSNKTSLENIKLKKTNK